MWKVFKFTALTSLQRFVIKTKNFKQQYAHIYISRMTLLHPVIAHVAQEKCNELNCAILPKIIDLKTGETRILAGTLYKDMPMKPCILDEITEEVCVAARQWQMMLFNVCDCLID